MAAAIAVALVFGAIIGSFLTVVVTRVPAGESIVAPGSACPACGSQLRWRDNIPLVSWLALRGRCGRCGERISIRYPALEAATAFAFGLIVAIRGVDTDLVLTLPFAAMLIAVAVIDIEYRVVPNAILVIAAPYAVVAGALVDLAGVPEQLGAGAAAFAAFLAIALAYPGGMGMGDVKLAGVLGLYLGLAVLPATLTAFLTGSIAGLGVIARDGRGARKQALPFAPFLVVGAFVGVLAGQELIDLYADRFL